MGFEFSKKNNVVVIQITNELISFNDSDDLSKILNESISVGEKRFILDISRIKFFNSSHIGIAVRAFTTVKLAGGSLKISGVSDKVKKIFKLSMLDKIMELYSSYDLALTSFK